MLHENQMFYAILVPKYRYSCVACFSSYDSLSLEKCLIFLWLQTHPIYPYNLTLYYKLCFYVRIYIRTSTEYIGKQSFQFSFGASSWKLSASFFLQSFFLDIIQKSNPICSLMRTSLLITYSNATSKLPLTCITLTVGVIQCLSLKYFLPFFQALF